MARRTDLAPGPVSRVTRATTLGLAALVVGGLLVDAVVHVRLAPGYQPAQPAGIGAGNLFRVEAVAALLAALYVVFRRTPSAFLVAALVGSSALAAVVLYRYVEVPAIGPIPSMYEPVWFFQKSLSAVAEGAVAVLGLAGTAFTRRTPR